MITIDLNKIDKTRIQERTYPKEGVEVTVKEYKMEVVPLNLQKTIKEGGSWYLRKTHFVCDSQTKEERAEKKDTNYLGEGIMFEDKKKSQDIVQEESIKAEDVPF